MIRIVVSSSHVCRVLWPSTELGRRGVATLKYFNVAVQAFLCGHGGPITFVALESDETEP